MYWYGGGGGGGGGGDGGGGGGGGGELDSTARTQKRVSSAWKTSFITRI